MCDRIGCGHFPNLTGVDLSGAAASRRKFLKQSALAGTGLADGLVVTHPGRSWMVTGPRPGRTGARVSSRPLVTCFGSSDDGLVPSGTRVLLMLVA